MKNKGTTTTTSMHLPCPRETECGSSDGYTEYSDGHGYCFACSTYFPPESNTHMKAQAHEPIIPDETNEPDAISTIGSPFKTGYRGIDAGVYNRYRVTCQDNEVDYPYYSKAGTLIAYKRRFLKEKGFACSGKINEAGLFGQNIFPPDPKTRITVTEGEQDAMAVFQMNGMRYPAVSVKSASQALRDIKNSYDYLNGFAEIYICFDNDEAGRKATEGIGRLFKPGKVKVVSLATHKDANEYLMRGHSKTFIKEWWAAETYTPAGIITDVEKLAELAYTRPVRSPISYPWETLDDMLQGIRGGEMVLVTAPTGVGKSHFLRDIMGNLITQGAEGNMALFNLEENSQRTIWGVLSSIMHLPMHMADTEYDQEELDKVVNDVIRSGRVAVYDNFGSTEIDSILDKIRYLNTVHDARYVFLDHISIMVSDQHSEDERKTLDSISTKLRTFVEETGITLFLVSHENDNGQTRGSRAIAQLADVIIRLNRDQLATDEADRNLATCTVVKNRPIGLTGPASELFFDRESWSLVEKKDYSMFNPVEIEAEFDDVHEQQR